MGLSRWLSGARRAAGTPKTAAPTSLASVRNVVLNSDFLKHHHAFLRAKLQELADHLIMDSQIGSRKWSEPLLVAHMVKVKIPAKTLAGFRASDMASVLRPGQLWLTAGGGQLNSRTSAGVLQLRLNVTGAEKLLEHC